MIKKMKKILIQHAVPVTFIFLKMNVAVAKFIQ